MLDNRCERLELKLRSNWLSWMDSLGSQLPDPDQLSTFLSSQSKLIFTSVHHYYPDQVTVPPSLQSAGDTLYRGLIQSALASSAGSVEVAEAIRRKSLDLSLYKAETIARTEMVRSHWSRSWEDAQEFIPSDGLMFWSSERGPRTCSSCLARNNTVISDPSVQDHPRGRCAPIFRSYLSLEKGLSGPDTQPQWLKPSQEPQWDTDFLREAKAPLLAQALGNTLNHSLTANLTLQRLLCQIVGHGLTIREAAKALVSSLPPDVPLTRSTHKLLIRALATRAQALHSSLKPLPPTTVYRGGDPGDRHLTSWTTSKRTAGLYALRNTGSLDTIKAHTLPKVKAYSLPGEQEELLILGTYLPQIGAIV